MKRLSGVSDVTNLKQETCESIKEDPAARRSSRIRRTVNYNESSSLNKPQIIEENKANISKKLKIKKENDDPTEIKQEKIENDEKNTIKSKESKPQRTSKSTKKKACEEFDYENDGLDDDDYEPDGKISKSSQSKKKKPNTEEILNENKEIIKTLKFTGDVPLDEKFVEVVGSDYKIYREGDVIFDCMLNQTNLQFNNNKYYLIQLIEKQNTKEFLVWFRWGRVGKAGQFTVERFQNNLNNAKKRFLSKFFDKTGNEWDQKFEFQKYPNKYDLVEKDYGASNKPDEIDNNMVKQEEIKKEVPPSKLDKRIQDLIELICNISEMESVLKEMKYDAKKSPLGKLSKSQIKAGYVALKEIEELIKNKSNSNQKLVYACNSFYTRIPHDFGMKVPPLINTPELLKEKMRLLEILDDVEVAIKVLNQNSDLLNPVDRHYDQLNCNLKPLDHNDKMFKIIQEYASKTHASTHNNYKLKIIDIFEAEKPGEKEKFKDLGNRMLLWHGSRMTNWAGILCKGLRIAPPEAPVTGYMFGKGCYFADCSSKSANYCYPSSTKSVGFLSLSEVSLGICNELKQADYDADKLPEGKHSTKGIGRSQPNKSEWITLDDGCVVPCGKLKNSVDKKDDISSYSLLYNEFIVYNVDQVKLRYLVKVEFDFENLDD